jgi:hypothetical protein
MTHPDSDVLAEFRAGLITGRSGARISAHLATCERCTGLSDQLAEISVLLAAVPAAAMPDAVAQRLEGVLAAEAAHRDSSERAAGDSTRDRAAGSPPRRHWDFRLVSLRVLAPAAAVVLLAAGGFGLSRIAGSSTSSQAASSGVASASSSAQAQAGAAAAPSASAPTRSREAAPANIEAPAKLGVVTSDTDYQPATLAPLLERELRLHQGATVSVPELTPSSLRGCVLRVISGIHPGTLLWVEKAHYQGQPAIVIVARSGRDDAARVIASGCSASSDHALAMMTLPGTSAP